MSVIRQCLLGAAASYLCFSLGLIYAWPSSTFKLFMSPNTTLHRPMNEGELALFGSLSSVGALLVTPVMGILMDVVGRKWCTVAGALMQVISWTIIVSSSRVEAVLVAIFLSGAGGSSLMIIPVYIAEFCQESIRGGLSSSAIVFYGIGMLVSYLLGGYLVYAMMNYISLLIAAIGVVLICSLKESPMFLMKKGYEADAIEAIMFFRGLKRDSKELLQELETLRRALNPDMENIESSPEEEKLQNGEIMPKPKEKLSIWQFLRKSRSTRRAMAVVFILILLSIMQGLVVFQVYAEPLFEEAVPTMSATLGSVILAVMIVLSGFLAAYLVDTIGRKALMMWASLVSGVFALLLASDMQLHWAPHWLTAVMLYGFCIAGCAGSGTVPYVLLAEVFLPEVRSVMSMVSVEFAWLCNFVVLFIFNPIVAVLGLGSVFYIFAGVSAATLVFTYFCVPETMGLPVDAIQLLFAGKPRRHGRS